MKLSKTVSVNTYACSIQFIITDNIKKTEKELIKKHQLPDADDTGEAEGFTLSITNSLYIIVLDIAYLNHNTAAHEMYHATQTIGRHRDIKDEETLAWVAGFIAEEFYKFLGTEKVKAAVLKSQEKNYGTGQEPGV
jgi:frataxin-like iron-binding protein CyaY